MGAFNKYYKVSPGGAKSYFNVLAYPVTIGILVITALVVGFLMAYGMKAALIGLLGALFGLLIIHRCLVDPIKGIYLLMFIAFFTAYPGRIIDRALPISTFVELLVLFLFIGTYWNTNNDENQRGNLLNYPISIALIIYTLYYIIEVFNSNVDSPLGWIFSSKRFVLQILFFIIAYRLINTPERVRFFIKFWIVMSFIAALYGCLQQWFGLLPFELRSIDPHEYGLLFQGGVIRKFSIFDGVVTFGSLSGCMSVIAIILAIHQKISNRKIKLLIIAFILFLGMLYSGTRTFMIMVPAGMALYILVTLKNKATIVTAFVTFLCLILVLFAPIDTPSLNRLRSTFNTSDESLNVRTINRRSIQPYIYTHPVGGGVATTGIEGRRFHPTHYLAGFPPDSGLLKLALEVGWIGLLIAVFVFLMTLYQGIYYFFRIKNEEYRTYIIACTCGFFALIITLYAQVTIGPLPTVFFIFGMMSIFKRLMEFDENESGQEV